MLNVPVSVCLYKYIHKEHCNDNMDTTKHIINSYDKKKNITNSKKCWKLKIKFISFNKKKKEIIRQTNLIKT
jgi:transposase-like protein